MNSSAEPQTQFRISNEARVGSLSVDTVSFILLGIGALLPIVFLVAVALVLRCHRKRKDSKEERWKSHLNEQQRSSVAGGNQRNSRRERRRREEETNELSISFPDSDVDPYFVSVVNSRSSSSSPPPPPPPPLSVTAKESQRTSLRRSELNDNVFFSYSQQGEMKRGGGGGGGGGDDVDSAIATDSDRSADHQSAASASSSTADYQQIQTHLDSSNAPAVTGGRGMQRGGGHGVIMGVNYLMENAGRTVDGGRKNKPKTGRIYDVMPEGNAAAAPPGEYIYATPVPASERRSMAAAAAASQLETLKTEEDRVLRYFENSISMEFDDVVGNRDDVTNPLQKRRNSNFYSTKL